ncbi:MAG TPA: hypothetical protein VFX86_04410 [Candidatus Saccharimonadales bacterium]|nr:hypothetical protein [Candidatus Saccharimonadales bacterium]
MPATDDTKSESSWYKPKTDQVQTTESRPVAWTASEFIDHQKGTGWYLAFCGGLSAAGLLIFIFTRDYISTGAVIIAGGMIIILAKRKPRQLPYEVNDQGVNIGGRFHRYENFKSFGINQEEGVRSISFMPLKRFMPDISIYFPPEQETAILKVISNHLPHNDRPEKTVDRVAKKLRF